MRTAQSATRHWLTAAALFIRAAALPFSLVLPLLGAGTVSQAPSRLQTLALIGLALSFHVFAYVVNDIVDLPVDRTQALRQQYPLVAGNIKPGTALAIALLQVPLAALITFSLHPGSNAYVALVGAFCLLAAYDIWGKRVPFPPLMDFLQGAGWSMLVLYGAYVTQGVANPLTGVMCVFTVIYVLLINGIHGSLRDLSNDSTHHIRTTPMLFGVRMGEMGLILSRPFVLYGICLHGLLLITLLLPLALHWVPYTSTISLTICATIVVVFGLSLVLPVFVARNGVMSKQVVRAGTVHILALLCLPIILLLPMVSFGLATALLLVYLTPLLWTFAPGR
jgi:4-hydroxybenzoate polyprenyltransferase